MPRFKLLHRVRRHALQRLADPEERPNGAGRADARRSRRHRPAADRALRRGPHRRGRARARAGGPSRRSARACRPRALRRTINDALPADINILSVEKAPHRFHARHDAVSRAYVYQIARRRTAFGKPFVWWVRDPLDMAAMRAGAAGLTGRRDFRGFTDDDPDEKSTHRRDRRGDDRSKTETR